MKSIKGKVVDLSIHKFASNVVEKCLQHGGDRDRAEVIDEILESTSQDDENGSSFNGVLQKMMKDRYGNYVI